MKITIVSPAKCVGKTAIQMAQKQLEQAGFQVEISPNVTCQHRYFAGTDKERLSDMQQALNDVSTDFILCARGGYGTVRLVNALDYTQYINHPKPLIGFSDITVMHSKMRQLNLPSVHASMPILFNTHSNDAIASLLNVLNGQKNTYTFPAHACNRTGSVAAPVIGGNLAVLASLMGTPLELNTDNVILFLEDIDEAVYVIERLLWQFKMAGKLDNLKGLIIGGMTEIKDTVIPYDQTVEEVITEMVADYDFPVCFNFPAGHIDDNRAIVLGKEASLNITEKQTTFIQ